MYQRKNLGLEIFALCLILTVTSVTSAKKRPFYIIGHMVNSVREVEKFLDKGANVLESDIQFFSNGSVKEMYQGPPCMCNRNCLHKANLKDYLKHIRNITDPGQPNSYYEKMMVQFFDMKLNSTNNKTRAGHEIARHVLDYLWTEDGSRKQEVRALFYFDQAGQNDVVTGIINEFEDRGKKDMLGNIGFDGGSGDLSEIRNTFQKLGIKKNIWIGDGNIKCNSSSQPFTRLKDELSIRDSEDGFIDKVYAGAIYQRERMRQVLELRVDGIITDHPHRVLEVLQEPAFEKKFRLAGVDDDPFAYFDEK